MNNSYKNARITKIIRALSVDISMFAKQLVLRRLSLVAIRLLGGRPSGCFLFSGYYSVTRDVRIEVG